MIEDADDLRKFLSDFIIAGTLIQWSIGAFKTIKKLCKDFFKHGKHERR